MWHAQSAVPERRVVEVGSGGSSLDLSLCRAHPTITYLKPPLPGAVLNDLVFLEDGRLALQVALPDGEQQAWTLDPDSRLSSQRLGDVVAHAPLAVRPDGQSVAVLQARAETEATGRSFVLFDHVGPEHCWRHSAARLDGTPADRGAGRPDLGARREAPDCGRPVAGQGRRCAHAGCAARSPGLSGYHMRVGVVGTGGVAIRHLGVLSKLNGCSFVGHVSASRQRAKAQSLQWGGRAYDGVGQMLEREQPDAVWVCVTPDRHGAIEGALIEHGVPFFIEKPLPNDLTTAERIAADLEGKRLVVGVGYKFRALDVLARVRRMLEDRPAQLALGAWHDRTPGPDWWRDELRSGGQLVEQATHLIDLARVLLGEPRVLAATLGHHARPSCPDWTAAQVTAALLLFRDGVPATLTATCLLDGPLQSDCS